MPLVYFPEKNQNVHPFLDHAARCLNNDNLLNETLKQIEAKFMFRVTTQKHESYIKQMKSKLKQYKWYEQLDLLARLLWMGQVKQVDDLQLRFETSKQYPKQIYDVQTFSRTVFTEAFRDHQEAFLKICASHSTELIARWNYMMRTFDEPVFFLETPELNDVSILQGRRVQKWIQVRFFNQLAFPDAYRKKYSNMTLEEIIDVEESASKIAGYTQVLPKMWQGKVSQRVSYDILKSAYYLAACEKSLKAKDFLKDIMETDHRSQMQACAAYWNAHLLINEYFKKNGGADDLAKQKAKDALLLEMDALTSKLKYTEDLYQIVLGLTRKIRNSGEKIQPGKPIGKGYKIECTALNLHMGSDASLRWGKNKDTFCVLNERPKKNIQYFEFKTKKKTSLENGISELFASYNDEMLDFFKQWCRDQKKKGKTVRQFITDLNTEIQKQNGTLFFLSDFKKPSGITPDTSITSCYELSFYHKHKTSLKFNQKYQDIQKEQPLSPSDLFEKERTNRLQSIAQHLQKGSEDFQRFLQPYLDNKKKVDSSILSVVFWTITGHMHDFSSNQIEELINKLSNVSSVDRLHQEEWLYLQMMYRLKDKSSSTRDDCLKQMRAALNRFSNTGSQWFDFAKDLYHLVLGKGEKLGLDDVLSEDCLDEVLYLDAHLSPVRKDSCAVKPHLWIDCNESQPSLQNWVPEDIGLPELETKARFLMSPSDKKDVFKKLHSSYQSYRASVKEFKEKLKGSKNPDIDSFLEELDVCNERLNVSLSSGDDEITQALSYLKVHLGYARDTTHKYGKAFHGNQQWMQWLLDLCTALTIIGAMIMLIRSAQGKSMSLWHYQSLEQQQLDKIEAAFLKISQPD